MSAVAGIAAPSRWSRCCSPSRSIGCSASCRRACIRSSGSGARSCALVLTSARAGRAAAARVRRWARADRAARVRAFAGRRARRVRRRSAAAGGRDAAADEHLRGARARRRRARRCSAPARARRPRRAARAGLRSLCSRDPSAARRARARSPRRSSRSPRTRPTASSRRSSTTRCFGLPGAVAYRAVNTLDAMIGYRGRYEYLGKASARLDDLLNFVPARLTALLLLVAGAARRAGACARACASWRRDGAQDREPERGPADGGDGRAARRAAREARLYRLGDRARRARGRQTSTRAWRDRRAARRWLALGARAARCAWSVAVHGRV